MEIMEPGLHKRKMRKTEILASRLFSFPDDLVFEILSKLPVKNIYRARLVSKHWNSMISDPLFAYNYCLRNPQQKLTLVRQRMFVEGSKLDNADPLEYKILNSVGHNSYFFILPFPRRLQQIKGWADAYRILGSSNGLLLCSSVRMCYPNGSTSHCDYYICNPLTREWIELPTNILSFKRRVTQVGFTTQLQGFLTVASYRVVLLHRVIQTIGIVMFEVYSSEIDEWRVYTMTTSRPLQVPQFEFDNGWTTSYIYKYVETSNGMLHWVENSNYNAVISYNPYSDNRSCRLISLPKNQLPYDKMESRKTYYKWIDAYNGNLRYLEVFGLPGEEEMFRVCIWMLEDCYEDSGTWNLVQLLKIRGDGFDIKTRYQILGPFHDSGTMYVWWMKELLEIYKKTASSNETMELRDVYDPCDIKVAGEMYRIRSSWGYILPLRLPIWPTTLNITKLAIS